MDTGMITWTFGVMSLLRAEALAIDAKSRCCHISFIDSRLVRVMNNAELQAALSLRSDLA